MVSYEHLVRLRKKIIPKTYNFRNDDDFETQHKKDLFKYATIAPFFLGDPQLLADLIIGCHIDDPNVGAALNDLDVEIESIRMGSHERAASDGLDIFLDRVPGYLDCPPKKTSELLVMISIDNEEYQAEFLELYEYLTQIKRQ